MLNKPYSLSATIAMSLLGLCVAATFACKPKVKKPTALVVATEKAPLTLDPRHAADSYSDKIIRLVFNGLFRINEQLEPVPDLVEAFQISKDGTTYEFTLRQNIEFHDGQPFTAADAIATYNYIMDKSNESIFFNSFERVADIKQSSDFKFMIQLKEPYAPFLASLAIGIVPGSMSNKGIPFGPIGTGPFRVVENNKNEGVVVASYAKYFRGAPKIARIRFKPILEDTVRVLELLKGSVHFAQNTVPPMLLQKVRDSQDITVTTEPGISYQYMGFNMKDPILKNLAVRKAIAHAIDRQQIIKYKLKDLASPASGYMAPVSWVFNEDVPKYGYDPSKSKQLLDQAGLTDPDGDGPKQRFTLTYKTSTNPESVEIAEVLKDYLEKVGIGVDLKSMEFGVFFDDVKKGNFQLFTLMWTGVTEPDHVHYMFHSSSVPPNGANRGRYINPKLDQLIDLARTESSREKRKALYAQIQEILATDLPYVSLWYRDNILAVRSELTGYRMHPGGWYDYLTKATFREPNS